MSKDTLKFKQDGNSITMSDEQVYTKETLPNVYNSLKTHLDTLDGQIKQNEAQRVQSVKNLEGLNKDRETLAGRVETLEKFADKAHIQIKPILKDPKVNPQAAAEDNMKVMLKKLVKEILEEEEQEIKGKLEQDLIIDKIAQLPTIYDQVKYIMNDRKQIGYVKLHSLMADVLLDDYKAKASEINDATEILKKDNYITVGVDDDKTIYFSLVI